MKLSTRKCYKLYVWYTSC